MKRVASLIETVELAWSRESEAQEPTLLHEWIDWLLSRQVDQGRSAGLFEPTEPDWASKLRLPTGEVLRTRLATRNVLTMEVARWLHRIGDGRDDVIRAVERAESALRTTCFAVQHCTVGECAFSFVAYVLFLHSLSGADSEAQVAWRLQTLSRQRDGNGRWVRFPFYFTLHVLLEVGTHQAVRELAYARDACVRVRRRNQGEDRYAVRRRALVDRVLAHSDR